MLLNSSQIYNTDLETTLLSAAQSVHRSEPGVLVYFVWENGSAPDYIINELNNKNIYIYQPEQEYYLLTQNTWFPPLSNI